MYRIAIPSYQRAETLRDKTLAYLKRCGIEPSMVDVFIATDEEKAVYREVVPEVNLIVAVIGMTPVKNFISSYYPKGTEVLHMDDDIETLLEKKGNKLVEFKEIDKLAQFGFTQCRKAGTTLGMRCWFISDKRKRVMYKITKLKPLEENPRWITEHELEKLKKSIDEFEKMMEVRPIIVDENWTILGGNMRYKAIEALGMKEIPKSWVQMVEGMNEAQKAEFVIKDNLNYGEWDFDVLKDKYKDRAEELEDWGLYAFNGYDTEADVDYSILGTDPAGEAVRCGVEEQESSEGDDEEEQWFCGPRARGVAVQHDIGGGASEATHEEKLCDDKLGTQQ
jgi:hypothetical protein